MTTLEQIQTYLMDPANIALFATIGIVLVREVMFTFLRKQLGIKETQAEEIRERLDQIDNEEAQINQHQRSIAEAMLALGDMVNIAYQNSKLSPQAKSEIEKVWSPIVGTLTSIAIDNTGQIADQIEQTLNKILPESEDQPLLETIREIVTPFVQDAVNEQIEKLPEHIDNLSQILGSK